MIKKEVLSLVLGNEGRDYERSCVVFGATTTIIFGGIPRFSSFNFPMFSSLKNS
jgi:hypothetical protein